MAIKIPGPDPGGFTLIEMLMVLTILVALLGIAVPRLVETGSQAAVRAARVHLTSAISAARTGATRYGRTAYLVLNVAEDRLEILVDTSDAGGAQPASLHTVSLWNELAVDLQASHAVICFDPHGLAMPAGVCPGTAVTVRLRRAAVRDSVQVSTTGWVS